MPDFQDLTYLLKGSEIQQKGYHVLVSSKVMESLAPFDPVLAGTLPLDLFTDNSDIDILCCYTDAEEFIDCCSEEFDTLSDSWSLRATELKGGPGVVGTFRFDDFDFEIVGQPIPVKQQVAYVHMVNEWRVLQAKGPLFQRAVLELKKSGLKTEPAFARLLGLQGDPYEAMLTIPG